jgi:hypothetical protein
MKKLSFVMILTLFLCLIFLIRIPSKSYANNFVEIVRDDNALYSLNIDTVEDRIDHVVAWIKFIPRGTSVAETKVNGKKIDHILMFMAVNKNQRQIQSLTELYYLNGSVVNSYKNSYTKYRYDEVVPESYGQTIYDAIIYTNNLLEEKIKEN